MDILKPTLSSHNSHERDQNLLFDEPTHKYTIITEASNKNIIRWLINKNKWADFRNTNTLVGKGYHFIVSKTGFINKSGGCIVMMLDTVYGVRTVILLGSKNTKTRIPEAELLSQKNIS